MKERVSELMDSYGQGIMKFITSKEAAAIMGISNQALTNRRYRKENSPPYLKMGHLIRYRLSDVVDWMQYQEIPGC